MTRDPLSILTSNISFLREFSLNFYTNTQNSHKWLQETITNLLISLKTVRKEERCEWIFHHISPFSIWCLWWQIFHDSWLELVSSFTLLVANDKSGENKFTSMASRWELVAAHSDLSCQLSVLSSRLLISCCLEVCLVRLSSFLLDSTVQHLKNQRKRGTQFN